MTGVSAPVKARRGRLPRALIVGVALAVLGAGGYAGYRHFSAAPASAQTARQTATVARGDLRLSVSGPGTIAAAVTHTVQPQVTGRILSLPEVGQRVTRGELVAQIDPSEAQLDVTNARLTLQKAEATLNTLKASQATARASSEQSARTSGISVRTAQLSLEAARQTLEANERLYAIGGLSRQELDAARTAFRRAQAELESAQVSAQSALSQSSSRSESDAQDLKNAQLAVEQARVSLQQAQQALNHTKIYAPISGVVSEVPLTVGTVAIGNSSSSSQTLFTVIDTSSVDLPVQIDETQIGSVRVGQTAEVTLEALADQVFQGEVTTVSPAASVENNIAVFTVTVRLPNPEGLLKPGMTAEAEIIRQQERGVLLVPKRAVQGVRGRSYVQVAGAGGEPERRRIETGADDGSNVIVTSGLEAGETVLLPVGARTGGAASSGGQIRQGGTFIVPGGAGGPPPGAF
ncbi:HlyD family secretion protein [Deinobacterium chartae]|uniref:HlyD family secretion protein n=1 Tax=Deinobacterium chartae TaxID=521158 RepID=A0A841I2S9_9DEIO|nr:efflux RND transporter periplasmic adaptor subunit [Deinobacterium chartae]MBB6099366.1 HlyD family secretion protein [Deinobacterium chartae]